MPDNGTAAALDSPEVRRYNRTRRWLGIAELLVGFALLLVLLITGWTDSLRDIAYGGASQSYALAVFLYMLMLLALSKMVGLGLDYYGFQLEHRYQLSNQKLGGWIWDEVKGFLLTAVLGSALVELLYFVIREFPEHWWLIAWAGFLGIAVLLAQLAPVVFFPIFYKFEPLPDEQLKKRLVGLS